MAKEVHEKAEKLVDNDYTPLPHQIKRTNQHGLRTDGQAGDEEEEEVNGSDLLPK